MRPTVTLSLFLLMSLPVTWAACGEGAAPIGDDSAADTADERWAKAAAKAYLAFELPLVVIDREELPDGNAPVLFDSFLTHMGKGVYEPRAYKFSFKQRDGFALIQVTPKSLVVSILDAAGDLVIEGESEVSVAFDPGDLPVIDP